MNTTYNQNLKFSSRNKTIRFADDIARKVNREFPHISSTKIGALNSAKKYSDAHIRIWWAIDDMRSDNFWMFKRCQNFREKLNVIVDSIKKIKRGNCGEAADLAVLMAKANGIENCEKSTLIGPRNIDYDHAVVLVKDKKPYIIDAWLGFADYVPNAIKRYQKEHRKYFDFDKLQTEKMFVLKGSDGIYTNRFVNQKFTKDELTKLRQSYPEMIIQRKKDIK